jgi:hypothetical protein
MRLSRQKRLKAAGDCMRPRQNEPCLSGAAILITGAAFDAFG